MKKFILLTLALHSANAYAGIEQLKWLEGSWSGTVGNGVLEEHWTKADAGTIVAAVRMTAGENTAMTEIIVIREAGDSFEFNLQQFASDLTPRTPVQHMKVTSQGKQAIAFAAPDQTKKTGLLSVAYTRKGDQLTIEVLLAEGQTFTAC